MLRRLTSAASVRQLLGVSSACGHALRRSEHGASGYENAHGRHSIETILQGTYDYSLFFGRATLREFDLCSLQRNIRDPFENQPAPSNHNETHFNSNFPSDRHSVRFRFQLRLYRQIFGFNLRIPMQAGRGFRFHSGHRSELMPAPFRIEAGRPRGLWSSFRLLPQVSNFGIPPCRDRQERTGCRRREN